ncbi:MAG TPA: hypothetical protein VNS32_03160, partial [Flavisolibacter sp.]|nr:hypothetical protein [Flavisolibacter sp.]
MGSDTASIYIDSLRVPANKGMIGIWSLQGAYFSNLSYKETSNESLTGKDQMLYNTQAIKTWEISPAFSFRFSDIEHFDLSGFRNLQWKKALTEEDGLLNINRYARKKIFGKFKDNSEELVWLRYEWNEPKAGIKPFSFEFTNRCFIFLNGQKAFAGNNSFRLKGPLDRGSFDKHMRGNICYLPVQKGRNSLMIGVAGVANGWGFMGTFEDNSNKGFIKY